MSDVIHNEKELEFAIFCVENIAIHLNVAAEKVYDALTVKSDILETTGISLDEALTFFYHSDLYQLVKNGVSDMHCMSDEYLAKDLQNEYEELSGHSVSNPWK